MKTDKKLTPPNVIPSERVVLGSMLRSSEAVDNALEILKTDHFYRKTHQVIFDAMLRLHTKGEEIDLITVCQLLLDHPIFKKQPDYIANLSDSVSSPVHV